MTDAKCAEVLGVSGTTECDMRHKASSNRDNAVIIPMLLYTIMDRRKRKVKKIRKKTFKWRRNVLSMARFFKRQRNYGFSHWKHSTESELDYENSPAHKKSAADLKQRAKKSGRIDKELATELENEISYCRNVLRRVVSITKCLASRRISFRGTNEKFGSVNNEHFLMLTELLSEFDPFMAKHINDFGNKGSGSTSYLSKTAYVEANGQPVERFLFLIDNAGHKSEDLTDIVLIALQHLKLDIKHCRGQSYDNARNMSGQYSGIEANIKQRVVPKHPFFAKVQAQGQSMTLKSLSFTRWSARADPVYVVNKCSPQIIESLSAIKDNFHENAIASQEAKGIQMQLERLEISFLLSLCDFLLTRFDLVNKKRQDVNLSIDEVVKQYRALIKDTR
ncbi:uncharacterized protein LOC117178476 [Belonocnema kinseyi]|uniref:uncharacterized protein LOC117178476 n=1 Tax=Belonocnema kinseyi TaxID=2817044 RepID=UPI00143CD2B9|nr:uncharacterized protein LOC117178476 [Belonocnema kinseyi]